MNWKRQSIVAVCLIVVVVGILPFMNPGCGDIYVIDQTTGEVREATETEAKAIVEGIGAAAKVITVATGHPQYVIFIDLATRVAALAIGFFYGRKELSAKTVTQQNLKVPNKTET